MNVFVVFEALEFRLQEFLPLFGAEHRARDKDVLVATTAHVDDESLVLREFLRNLHGRSTGVRTFEREENAFVAGEELHGLERFLVEDARELHAARFTEGGELRADTHVVKPCRNRAGRQRLAVFVDEEAALVALHNAFAARVTRHAGSVLAHVRANATGFGTNQANVLVFDKRSEHADGVASATHAGDDRGNVDVALGCLTFDFFTDDGLERANDIRERGRTEGGTEHVVGVLEIRGPVAHGFVHGILQGAATARNRNDLRTVHFHGRHVRLLAAHIDFSHVHHAFEAELCASGGGGKPVLTGTRLRDNAGFAHLLGEQALTDSVVDLVGARVGEAFKLDVDLRTAQEFRGSRGEVQRSLAADVVALDDAELFEEFRIVDVLVEGRFEVVERAADDFGNVLAAELVKETVVRSR